MTDQDWERRLMRLLQNQQKIEAETTQKIQEHQARADAWAQEVVRPAFVDLAAAFQLVGRSGRELIISPEWLQPVPEQSRRHGTHQPSGPQVGAHVVGPNSEAQFSYVLTITAGSEGITVEKAITDPQADQPGGLKPAAFGPLASVEQPTDITRALIINDFIDEYEAHLGRSR